MTPSWDLATEEQRAFARALGGRAIGYPSPLDEETIIQALAELERLRSLFADLQDRPTTQVETMR